MSPSAHLAADEDLGVIFLGPRDAQLHRRRRPALLPEEALVRTQRTLLSPGTELSLYEGTHSALGDPTVPFAKYPYQPGYAALGVVEEVGQRVDAFRVGERILFYGKHTSWSVLNPRSDVWCCAPADLSDDTLLLARLVQIAATVTYCWRQPPTRVIVIGAGLIGLLAAQVIAATVPCEVVIQDLSAERVALAARNGIKLCVVGRGHSLAPALAALGAPPDCIVEATGVPALVPAALAIVKRGGDVVLLGSPRGRQEIDLYKYVHLNGAALIGAHEMRLPNRASPGSHSRQSLLDESLNWLRQGKIRVDGLITHTIRPLELPAIYERLCHDKDQMLGVTVDWT